MLVKESAKEIWEKQCLGSFSNNSPGQTMIPGSKIPFCFIMCIMVDTKRASEGNFTCW